MEDSILLSRLLIRECSTAAVKFLLAQIFRPRRVLEQIKGISEQKATKILAEGKDGSIQH